MRTGDKKAIEEIWSVFEKSFNQQRKEQQTQAKGLILKPYSFILSVFSKFRIINPDKGEENTKERANEV